MAIRKVLVVEQLIQRDKYCRRFHGAVFFWNIVSWQLLATKQKTCSWDVQQSCHMLQYVFCRVC